MTESMIFGAVLVVVGRVAFLAGKDEGWIECERACWPAIQRGMKAALIGEPESATNKEVPAMPR